jgi:hypothetical protein
MAEAGRAAARRHLQELAARGIQPPSYERLCQLGRKLKAAGIDSLSDIVTEERELRRKRAG